MSCLAAAVRAPATDGPPVTGPPDQAGEHLPG
jgi:hypothetical protein